MKHLLHIKIVTRLALVALSVLLAIGAFTFSSTTPTHAAVGTITFNWYDTNGALVATQAVVDPPNTRCQNLNVPSGFPLGSQTINASDRGIVVFAKADCDENGPLTNVYPGENQGRVNFFPKSFRVGICC